MTPAELDTLELAIPTNPDEGTNVSALAHALRWDERKVRQGFQELRRERRVAVVALPKPNGVYVLPEGADLADLEHTRNSLHSRAMSLLVTVQDLDQLIADREWSPTLFSELAS